MTCNTMSLRKLTLALSATAILLATMLLPSCNPRGNNNPPVGDQQNGGTTQPATFVWDTSRPVTRWRATSPIVWHKTAEMDAVLSESRTGNKPILVYVSRYDSDLTATIENGIFPSDSWGQTIADSFVAWEIDWWENPELAQSILGRTPAPALAVLRASPDAASNELRAIDTWWGRELLSFPLHQGIFPLNNPAAVEVISGFASTPWDNIHPVAPLTGMEIDPEAFAQAHLDDLLTTLGDGGALYPSECLFLAFAKSGDESTMLKLKERVSEWIAYLARNGSGAMWVPDKAFSPAGGWGIYPDRNIEAALTAVAVQSDYAVQPANLFQVVSDMIVLATGENKGGFPPYLDIRATFRDGDAYVDDEMQLGPELEARIADAAMGPRDIVWVNAKMLSLLNKLLNINPDVADIELSGSVKIGEFVDSKCALIIPELLAKAGDVSAMTLQDKTYLIDLLNQVYQRTGDIEFLNKAGEIAATFTPDTAGQWFDPAMFPLYPDLVVALHQYGWLAEDEPARENAKYITEHAIPYASNFPPAQQSAMAYAYMLAHTKCMHVGILGSPDDPTVKEYLRLSLQGWDPRRIAQIIDPTRDAELMERKGYQDMGKVAVMVCVDDMCYMPCFTPEDIRETIQMAVEDIAAEESEGDE